MEERGDSLEPGPISEATGDPRGPSESDSAVTVDHLLEELGAASSNRSSGIRLTPDQDSEIFLDEVLTSLFGDPGFEFQEPIVKANLDEILLMLINHRSSATHGKALMSDLATLFDTRLSPGTVYPRLHELEEKDILDVQELVRTKEYRIQDKTELEKQVRKTMEQHLVLGYFFCAALAEFSFGEN